MSLIGVLIGLYIFYSAVKYALSRVGINFTSLFGGNDFLHLVFKSFPTFFFSLFGFSFSNTKHQGFMSGWQKFFLLNRFHKGLLMNGKTARISQNNSFTHSIIVANTGRGKTSSFVIPNIFTLDDCSILVTDLSGELFEKTSGKMKEKGFEVKAINLAEPFKSNTFNPLASVKTDRQILEVVEILLQAGSFSKEDAFWNNGTRTILKILISCLISQREKEKNDVYCNLANLRYLLNSFGKDGSELTNFLSKYADETTLKDFKGFISGSEKTTQGFIATALSCLSIVGTDTIARLTATNEIDFNEIRTKKTIVYLIIPQHELTTYSFLLNLFYARFFKTCFESKMSNVLPVYCLLDEAGHTKIPHLATIIATIRKYKVSISLIFQSLSQMETQYGRNEAQTILGGGIASKIFFSGCDDETCNKLENILGKVTIEERNQQGHIYKTQKPLMSAQEIRMMNDNQALYLFSNKKPILMKIRPYFQSFLFNSYAKIKPCAMIDRDLPKLKYVNLSN